MLFQLYSNHAMLQITGWVLVFCGLIVMNELSRKTKDDQILSDMGITADPRVQGIVVMLAIVANVICIAVIRIALTICTKCHNSAISDIFL